MQRPGPEIDRKSVSSVDKMPVRLLAALLVLLLLTACAAEPAVGGDGSPTPEAAVLSFIEDLNIALKSPTLADPVARRGLAERLASRFAPSERADQRAVLGQMLADFADSAARPIVGSKVQLEVTYSGTEIITSSGDEALIGVRDGLLTLRWLDASGELLRERSRALTDVLGETRGGLPVLRVGSSWYMTER